MVGQPVHGRGGGGDDLADARVGSGFDDLVGAVDQDLEGQPRLGRALGDPDGGLVEHDIDPAHQPPHQAGVADVALVQAHPAGRQRLRQVLPAAADEVVQHDDLAGARRD